MINQAFDNFFFFGEIQAVYAYVSYSNQDR